MVRLSPESATAAAYRGEARLKSGDKAGAKHDFHRATQAAPTYGFPAFHLFDLELEDRDLDTAGAVLESLKTHEPGEYVDAREVRLALARNDLATASAVLARLCKEPLADSE